MNTAKHTPGPWCVGFERKMGDEKHGYVWWEVPVHVGEQGNRGNALASVSLGGDGAIRRDLELVKANARLMAAAPDLLNALKWAVKCRDTGAWLNEDGQTPDISLIEAAIAKAEGGGQ